MGGEISKQGFVHLFIPHAFYHFHVNQNACQIFNEILVDKTPQKLYLWFMRQLNEKEEAIMQVLWRLKQAFVKEILDELPPPQPPITTVSSTVRKLEAEGWIGHDSFGKSHRYFPKLEKSDYRDNSMKKMVKKYFGGSPQQVLSYFLEEKEIAPEELEQLLQQIKNKES